MKLKRIFILMAIITSIVLINNIDVHAVSSTADIKGFTVTGLDYEDDVKFEIEFKCSIQKYKVNFSGCFGKDILPNDGSSIIHKYSATDYIG